MKSSKRITGKVLSLILAIMMVFSVVTVGFTANAASVPTTVYLKPGNWSQANAWFSAYFWSDSVSGTFYKMTDDDSDGIYEVAVPAGVDKVIFVRNDPAKTALSWSSKWNQSADENLPTDGTNLYTLPSNISDKAAGTWGTYVPAKAPEAGDESSVQLAGDFTTWATSAITMVYAEDTNLVTTSVDLEAGTYKFKVIDGGTWKGNNNTSVNSFTDTVTDLPLAYYGSGDNVTLIATGGTYTFTYNLSADTISVAYTAPETTTKAPETTTEVPATTEAPATTVAPVEPEPEVFDGFYWEEADGLYAYAGVVAEGSIPNDNAWQRWDNPNSNSYRYFYLPASAAADSVIIYNTFSNAVTVNGVEIPSKGIATVPYTDSQLLTVTGAESKATGIKIMKSDAEATLYINNADGMTLLYEDGSTYTGTDLYGFLTGGAKTREAGKLGGAVADSSGVSDAGVKKIKGRGNSTWNLAKKPFNITYSSSVSIDGMLSGKKWSLLANAQDPSLIRNRIVYDLANEAGMKYACDSRFVDWFVNGDYKGSYQMTQKIEMGKGTVMPDLAEPEVEDVIEEDGSVTPPPTENFDFILELDTADNASGAGDLYFTTSRGQVMTFKTPDAPTTEQQSFIKAKYQAVEDALYGSKSLSTLEGLVDLNDFAKAYLVNEVAKNLDSGVTSCYFTYDSDAGKFYLSPVWDYDNAIGNSVSISGRHDVNGNMLDLQKPDGWYVRDLAHYSLGTLNVFGQAVSLTSKNSEGKTFLDIVKEVWASDFADLDDILEGTKTASGRLQTVDSYMNSLSKSGDWNYTYGGWTLSANNGWISDHSSLTMYDYDSTTGTLSQSTKSYDQYSLVGQANYASDWTISRINWLDAQLSTATPTPEPGTTKTVYVGVISYIADAPALHYWGGAANGDATLTATDETFKYTFDSSAGYWTTEQTFKVYTAEIPADATGLKLHNGDAWTDSDMTYAENQILLYFNYNGDHNLAVPYTPAVEPTTTPVTTTAAPETTTVVVTEPTPVTYVTIYFTNNWKWGDVCAYWTVGGVVDTAWPGAAMTLVETNTDGDDIYKITVPSNVDFVVFNGTKDTNPDERDQTPNITENIVENGGFYMVWDSATSSNGYGTYTYVPSTPVTTAAPETTKAPETTAAVETTAAPETTTATEPVETEVVYFTDGTSSGWIKNASAAILLYDYSAKVAYLGETTDSVTWSFTVPKGLATINFYRCASGTTAETFAVDTFYNSWTTGVSARNVATQNTYTATDNNVGTWNDEVVALQYFVRGEFNNWGTDNPMTENEDGSWTAVISLEAGTYQYKVGTADWGESYPGGMDNLTITLDAATDVTFTLSADKEVTATWDSMPTVTYAATWDETDATFTVSAESTEIAEGESFVFTVTAAEGYEIGAVLNGTTVLTSENGTYTIENVTADINLIIVTKAKEAVPATTYTVVFLGADGKFIEAQTVEAGADATAPSVEQSYSDAQYIYTFDKWDTDFTNVQGNLTVTAVYTSVVKTFTVTFVGKDGQTIDTAEVEYGKAATAPDAPAVDGYEFTAWDKDFDNVTEDMTVTALYKRVVTPPAPPTHGTLKIEVVGGTSFTIAVNGGNARPQGATYKNTKLPIGATVTVTAVNSGDATFIGWMNEGGTILSTDLSYTFISSGNDYLKAQFTVAIEGVNTVTFKNDKANGGKGYIVDMQYYAASDELIFPDGPSQAGYDFAGWNMTAEQIQAELAAGNDVVVLATWTVRQVYYNVVVNGGTKSDGTTEGEHLANAAVTVVAGEAPAGQKFAYWVDQNGKIKSYKAEYKFFLSYDIELTAVYVDEAEDIEYKVLAEITGDNTVAGNYINWTYSWYVPETEAGLDHVQSGILLIEDTYYDADTFYYGSGAANMVQYAPGTSVQLPENTWNTSKKDSFVGTTWHAVCWVRYIDAEGNAQIVYSDEAIVTKY